MQIEMLSQEIENYNGQRFCGTANYVTDLSFKVYDFVTVSNFFFTNLKKLKKDEYERYDYTLRIDGTTGCWGVKIDFFSESLMPLSLNFDTDDFELDKESTRNIVENFIRKYHLEDFVMGDINVDIFGTNHNNTLTF